MKPAAIQPSFRNKILASLPAQEIERLRPHLSPVTLKRNQTLHDAGGKVEVIYFSGRLHLVGRGNS
jgi:hypothetical protein